MGGGGGGGGVGARKVEEDSFPYPSQFVPLTTSQNKLQNMHNHSGFSYLHSRNHKTCNIVRSTASNIVKLVSKPEKPSRVYDDDDDHHHHHHHHIIPG